MIPMLLQPAELSPRPAICDEDSESFRRRIVEQADRLDKKDQDRRCEIESMIKKTHPKQYN